MLPVRLGVSIAMRGACASASARLRPVAPGAAAGALPGADGALPAPGAVPPPVWAGAPVPSLACCACCSPLIDLLLGRVLLEERLFGEDDLPADQNGDRQDDREPEVPVILVHRGSVPPSLSGRRGARVGRPP